MTTDICRVCRSEGSAEKPLFHPCICTGSIRYIHQDCLVQWLKYSKKEYCELCKHKFIFKPIYSADMPKRLPLWDITGGLMKSVGHAVRYWLQSTLVAIAWLGVVPLTACRIYRCLFTGSVSSLLTLPLDMLSTDNLVADCLQGCFVVTCTLCAFIGLVWLREQILHGGGPAPQDNHPPAAPQPQDGEAGGGEVQEADVAPQEHQAEPIAEEEVGQEVEEGAEVQAEAPQQDNEWNPIEWDRAAEELTWERLLGLDGSLVFLEHVFWVVSLNTLFILVFAFCPYHIGRFTVMGLKLEDYFAATQFEGLLTAFLGYVIISLSLVILQTIAARATFNKLKHILSLSYMVVKVSILVVIEIGIFPLVCGWWLDICSLNMFETSLKERASSFRQAPGTSVFIHWLVGMVYVFYFASFILLLREVLRPGVLWFLRNLNDPEFNPINEMIHLPVYRHIRRFLASMVIFGSTVLMMLWFPIRLIRMAFPGFLPYNVMLSSDAPVSELSLELLLLQVVLPALLEQGYTRQWLKGVIRKWCIAVAWLLNLRSYLLGEQQDAGGEGVGAVVAPAAPPVDPVDPVDPVEQDAVEDDGPVVEEPVALEPVALEPAALEPVAPEPVAPPEPAAPEPAALEVADQVAPPAEMPADQAVEEVVQAADDEEEAAEPARPAQGGGEGGPGGGGLGAAHQAMLLGGAPVGFQPYDKPDYFLVRLVVLVILMCWTLFVGSVVCYVVPVWIGRRLMSLWMKEARVHELYTAACGLYTCWLLLRGLSVLTQWLPKGLMAIINNLRQWLSLLTKSLVVAIILVGVVPLLLGILFELIVVIPLRVPLEQSPLFFPWQDWALGILHAKIVCAVTLMCPHWWLRRIIEQVYNQGWRNMDVVFILKKLCFPVIGCLSMCIALPYVAATSLVYVLGLSFDQENVIVRRIYPSLMCITLFNIYLVFQVKQFKKLYEHIKNDKYLVGQRLVNYENPLRQS